MGQRIDDIIGALYEAAADQDQWPICLRLLAECFSASVTQFAAIDRDKSICDTVVHGADQSSVDLYVNYYCRLDPRISRMQQRAGLISTNYDLVDDIQAFRRTEFYNGLLVPHDCQTTMTASFLGRTWMGSLSIMSPEWREATAAELEIFRALNPHFARAAQIATRLGALKSRLDATERAVNALSGTVLLVDRAGTVLLANDAATAMLSRGDGLITVQGRIACRVPSEANTLTATIAATHETSVGGGRSSGGVIEVSRPDRRPLAVLVVPLRLSRNDDPRRPTVALFVRDPETEHLPPRDVLSRLYGLTNSEARVALGLLSGQSVDEVANELAITVQTARTYLKSALHKTETGRQSELVKLLERQFGWVRL